MPAASKITLYVDLVSPFGYMAYYLLRHDPAFKSVDITYVPIFLGGLMKACGNTAPLNITNKNVWIGKERNLWAKTFNIPMKDGMPGGFPILTLVLMRHLAALRQLDGNQNRLVELLDIFSRELWVNHADVHKPEVFSPILQKVLGNADAAKVAEAAAGPLKKLLNDNTDQAFNDQAFGLPWMVCTNAKGEKESFWGVDHMGQLALFLGLEKPTTRGWQAVL